MNLTTKTGEWPNNPEASEHVPLEFESWSLEKGDALLAETKAFLNAVRTGEAVVVTGDDGLNAMRVATAIQKEIYARLEKFGQ